MRRSRALLATALAGLVVVGVATTPWPAGAASVSEDFVTAPPAGWKVVNQSAVIGTTTWRQGFTTGSLSFPAYSGAPTSYVRVDYNAGGGNDPVLVDDWLITPAQSTLTNGDTFSFYTRSASSGATPDRLQVRLSTNGTTCAPAGVADGVGDFTTLLLDINPTLAQNVYPSAWTRFAGTLSGLPAGGATGCLGFRYYVANSGIGPNGYAIGIDSYAYTETVLAPTVTSTATATATATARVTTTATATATTTGTATAGPVATATATATATSTATVTPPAPAPTTVTATPSATTAPSTCQPTISTLYAAQTAAANAGAKAFKTKLNVKRAKTAAQKAKAAKKAKSAKAAAATAAAALTAAETAVGAACK